VLASASRGFPKRNSVCTQQTKMIDMALLTQEERDWLNTYHQEVWEKVGKDMGEGTAVKAWLRRNTLPV
jgi:Xaa-Pro aminopeptidase